MAIVVGGDPGVGLGERHLHQLDRRAEEREVAVHLAADVAVRRRAIASSMPSHDGSIRRVCIHANCHGIARSACSASCCSRPRRPAADVHRVELGFRRRGAEVVEEPRVVVDGPAERVARVRRQPVHRRAPRRARPAAALRERRFERRRRVDLERAERDARQTELRLDHLALFGDAQRAVDRSRRLRADREVRRAAAAADAAAAAVEERDRHAVRAAGLDDGLLRFVELPRRRQPADVLGRVRVADHHFQPALVLHDAVAVPRDREQRSRSCRRPRADRARFRRAGRRGAAASRRPRAAAARPPGRPTGFPAIVIT